MSDQIDRPTHRREFLGQLATTAVVLAGTACVTSRGGGGGPLVQAPATSANDGAASPPKPKAPPQKFDDSWTARLTARHKSVYDSPAMKDGDALGRAWSVMSGYHEAIGAADSEMNVVIVIRHAGIPMAFNDAIWAKYELGKEYKLKDPTTGEPARRNPFWHAAKGDKYALVGPEQSLETLHNRGVILLACNRAAMARASMFAQKTKADADAVRQEIRDNLVPGVVLQPNGIYAVARAQEMGCALISAG